MDWMQFTAEMARISTGLAWPIAVVAVAYIVKQALDNTDVKAREAADEIRARSFSTREADYPVDRDPPADATPRITVRPTGAPRPDAPPARR